MNYILTFCVGCVFGFIVTAIVKVGGHADEIQEAYNLGYKDGLKNNKNKE